MKQNRFIQFCIVFVMLAAAAFILNEYFHFEFGNLNYWDRHGLLFLVFITFFPRLTLLFSSVPFGGLLWWLGWLFVPRILVAVLATVTYWNQNPILVTIAWLVAIGGESTEKTVVVRRSRRASSRGAGPEGDIIDITPDRRG
jgi:hypothetical protein